MHISEKVFNIEKMNDRTGSPAVIYTWAWNGTITHEETDKRLEELQRLGIQNFYILPEPKQFRAATMPTELEPEYLTDAFMEEVKYAIDRAAELGMHCWIYDEGGWPSGGACGKVLKAHPEYARRFPVCIETEFEAGSTYKKSREDILAAFFKDGTYIEEGYRFDEATVVDEYYAKAELFPNPGFSDFPDASLKEATECFLEMTHDKYASCLSSHFGEGVGAVFTDEPTLPRPFPIHDRILKAYEEKYGESVLPYLPVLCGNVKPDEKGAQVRIRWFDLCSQFFCEGFLLPCRKWANEHGLAFTGHMDKDNTAMGIMQGGNFHILRSLRCMDIPGVDVIWRHIFPGQPGVTCAATDWPGETATNGFFPRYASSAAAQIGADASVTESMGVYGDGVTYEQMRFIYGFQAIRGVNIFNQMLITYDRRNYMMAGEKPAFREDHACHADLKTFNAYLERLSYVTSVGERVCDTALYFPVRDIWAGVRAEEIADEFEKVGMALEAKQIDFDILDDDILETAEGMEQGEIRIGKACYKKVVLPPCEHLSEKSKENLAMFEANGGVVCTADALQRPTVLVGDAEKLQLMQRKTETQDIYCLFNGDTKIEEAMLDLGGKTGYFINITDGTIEPLTMENGLVKLTLQSGETGAVCIAENVPALAEKACPKRALEIDGFTFRRLTSFEIGEVTAQSVEIEEAPKPIVLGDWSGMTGKAFSGSGMYETKFTLPADDFEECILDLGDVRYTAEVFLNGKSLGKRVMPPYCYNVKKADLSTENSLKIIVKNTPGNAYYYTKSFDKWPAWMLSPYFNTERRFDEETLASGLYGCVKILY